MRNLTPNSEVNYVAAPDAEGGKVTTKKATVIEVISPGAARLQVGSDGNHFALATYSSGGEMGTFHFADESKSVKEMPTAFKPGAPSLPVAAPAEPAKK